MKNHSSATLFAPVNNLKLAFRDIRGYLAGNSSGITRDEEIAQNVIRLLFCKFYAETNYKEEMFSSSGGAESTKDRISDLFELVKEEFDESFMHDESINLNAKDIFYIVSMLEDHSITDSDRDVICDAFEEFIGTSFRGSQGQFFTPKNIVKMVVDILQPVSGESIIDPACGSGGFISHALQYTLKNRLKNCSIVGIDKDSFLARIASTYLSLIDRESSDVFCENSLDIPVNWKSSTRAKANLNSFDMVITNPPFGAKIPITDKHLLRQYALGHEWQRQAGKWIQSKRVQEKQPPQILFLERCLDFLKDGGRMAIVLPDGMFGNPSERYIWEHVEGRASVTGLVSLSQEAFQPSTHTKTSVLFLEKRKTAKSIFMAIAKSVGHNKNGREVYKINSDGSFVLDENGERILDDDLPEISSRFAEYKNSPHPIREQDHLGFTVSQEDIQNSIYIPEHYDPEISNRISSLKKTESYSFRTIGDLVSDGLLEIKRGNEIGSKFYGSGNIPFVRTSDIVNWEIKFDPIKSVSESVYDYYKHSQDVKKNDILMVNDGTFLIGRTALVTELDLRIVIQSHLRKIRVLKESEELNPFYLLYLLNTSLVQEQIKSKTFTQATISTIGNRIGELILPFSTSIDEVNEVTQKVMHIIELKEKAKRELSALAEKDL